MLTDLYSCELECTIFILRDNVRTVNCLYQIQGLPARQCRPKLAFDLQPHFCRNLLQRVNHNLHLLNISRTCRGVHAL